MIARLAYFALWAGRGPAAGPLTTPAQPGRKRGAFRWKPARPPYNEAVSRALMALEAYRRKRSFEQTPEPPGALRAAGPDRSGAFVIQKHAARRLHYDLRLDIGGALASWAVPKGPSLDPKEKRLAVRTENHPREYLNFEGVIPAGGYGAGSMMVWDFGYYVLEDSAPAGEQLARGEIKLLFKGRKLRGGFVLVKTKRKSGASEEWLLIKHRDAYTDPGWDPEALGESVLSGRTMEEIAGGAAPHYTAAISPAASLDGAEPGPMPELPEPMLAASAGKPFSGPAWLFEIKWDGVRALAEVRELACRLVSRKGRDFTARYPEALELPKLLAAREALLDGEIVVLDERGRASFERLQTRMHVDRPPAALLRSAPVVYYLFDILYCDGYDLRRAPLMERKRLLEDLLRPTNAIRYSGHVVEKGAELFELARQQGAEGVIGKQIQSEYIAGRSPTWVKIKATRETDAVVVGYTEPQGGRAFFGALELALYDNGRLRYIGGAGSGFTESSQRGIFERLKPLRTGKCPLAEAPVRPAVWVRPQLVVRVRFSEWTQEGRLRHPVFAGLREDIDPSSCRLEDERPAAPPSPKPSAVVKAPPVAALPVRRGRREIEEELFHGKTENVLAELDGKTVRLTHLNKVYFPEKGFTKRDTLAYYWRVAEFMLPFLRDRPLVLQRHPNGIHGQSFYQKDAGSDFPDWISTTFIYSSERGREMPYFLANNLADLLFLTNRGCIEHNPWSSRAGALDQPDYVFFDLDPAEGTPYATVVEVARGILRWLERLELKPFLKTSGKRGFHLYLPLAPGYSYDQARGFAEILARVVAAQMPQATTLERSVEKRPRGTVYLDYSQNAEGRPLVSIYSLRPVPEASASAPVAARQLRKNLNPANFNLVTLPKRLGKSGDLWAEFWRSRQRIETALDRLQSEVRKLSGLL